MVCHAQPDPYFFQPACCVRERVMSAREIAAWCIFEHTEILERRPEDGTWCHGRFRYSIWLFDRRREPRLIGEWFVRIRRRKESALATRQLVRARDRRRVRQKMKRILKQLLRPPVPPTVSNVLTSVSS